jgi:hypothetical protein
MENNNFSIEGFLFKVFASAGIGLVIVVVLIKISEANNVATYCGTVVDKYITAAGYKVSAQRHVVIYNDSLSRNIDVRVTNQTYVNLEVGDKTCFELSESNLKE